jgi:SPP1 gp7 family putative phage head morphogenesis protein
MSRAHTLATLRALAPVRAARRSDTSLPRQLWPSGVEAYYRGVANAMLGHAARLIREEVLEEVPRWQAEVRTDGFDDFLYALETIRGRLWAYWTAARLLAFGRTVGKRVSDHHRDELGKQVRAALGVDLFLADKGLARRLEGFAVENATLIKSVPDRYLNDVAARVSRAVREGRRASDLAAELHERLGVAESHAALIARDQIGKLQAGLNASRQQELGVTHFIWRTVGDERVRKEHQSLDGKKFAWEAPPAEGLPGEPINCRCEPEPVFDEILEE